MTDFAKCPKRTSTCPSPSYCQPTCTHLPDWFARPPRGLDMDHAPDVEALARLVEEVEADGDVTLYPRMGAME